MGVTGALEALRSELSGCSLVAYADLTSALVLGTSSAGNPGQEELDALSGAAQQALAGTIADGAAPAWSGTDGAAPADLAILFTESDARLFLRATGAAEALICLCAPESDLARAVEKARAALARLQEETA